jgi:hypothetical protein
MRGRREFSVGERGGERQQRGEAGAIVAGAGAVDARAVFMWSAVGSGGEDGVEMSGEENQAARVQGRGSRRQFSERVAFGVDVRVVQP